MKVHSKIPLSPRAVAPPVTTHTLSSLSSLRISTACAAVRTRYCPKDNDKAGCKEAVPDDLRLNESIGRQAPLFSLSWSSSSLKDWLNYKNKWWFVKTQLHLVVLIGSCHCTRQQSNVSEAREVIKEVLTQLVVLPKRPPVEHLHVLFVTERHSYIQSALRFE